MSLKHKLKMWNKGGFNFWLVGLNYMRKRDAVMGRFLTRSEEKLERKRIVRLLESELPRLAKNFYTSFRPSGEDFAKEVVELIKGEQK